MVSLDPMYVYFDMDEPTLLRIKRAINDPGAVLDQAAALLAAAPAPEPTPAAGSPPPPASLGGTPVRAEHGPSGATRVRSGASTSGIAN